MRSLGLESNAAWDVVVSATLDDEKRLRNDLALGYNRLVRPVEKNTDQLIVKFGIRLIQILDVVSDRASSS